MASRFKTIRHKPIPTRRTVLLKRFGPPPPLACPVCRGRFSSYIDLARHLTKTADLYVQHVNFVEQVSGEGFLKFAVGEGGIKRLAEVLERGGKQTPK